ncbi:MAG: transporter, partial [Deltaproteobacteria bacterium]|nr:transporter [Deltaproteobacteria bacterium]
DVDLEVKGFATVPVLFWAKGTSFLGGARYFAFIAPNYFTTDYQVVGEVVGGGSEAGSEEGSLSGWSDLLVAPVGLSWAFGRFGETSVSDEDLAALGMPPLRRFNLTTLYSFVAPTGRYTTGADDNLGLGFWTHQFQAFGYYYPFEHQAIALMAGLTYELNSSIEDAEVNPGNRLSVEWGLSRYLTPRFELSVHGAHNWQITDDSGADVFWDPAVHDRKNSLMLGAGFWPWEGRLYASLRWGFDYGMRQRFGNTNLMLNFVFLTNLLDGR